MEIIGPAHVVTRVESTLGGLAVEESVCAVLATPDDAQVGLSEVTAFMRDRPRIWLVVVVPTLQTGRIRALVAAGARAIVLEAEIEGTLRQTVAAVCAGQIVFPAKPYLRLAKPALSFREKQTLAMVTLGLTNADIARKLWLTESAVKSHLSNAFAKLGVHSRNEATALILDPETGLGTGILHISPEDERISVAARTRHRLTGPSPPAQGPASPPPQRSNRESAPPATS